MRVSRDMIARAREYLAARNIHMDDTSMRLFLTTVLDPVPEGLPQSLLLVFRDHIQDSRDSMERLNKRLESFIAKEKGIEPS